MTKRFGFSNNSLKTPRFCRTAALGCLAQQELRPPGLLIQRVAGILRGLSLIVICGSSLVCETQAEDKLPELKLVARTEGGLLCTSQGKQILIVAGTPQQMGTAHGTLMKQQAQGLIEKTVYLVGAAETIRSGRWFMDNMADIERRVGPHVPKRFVVECDALSKAAGISIRDGHYANLSPCTKRMPRVKLGK